MEAQALERYIEEDTKSLKTEIDQLKDKVKEFAGDDEAIGREGEIIAT